MYFCIFKGDIVGNTPLHLASITNHIKMITLLLKSGTDINALDNSGRTPLHLARSKLKLLHGSKSRHVKEEILQIIEMMTVYLQRVSAVTMGSQRDQLDLLSSFSNRLHLHQRQEEVYFYHNFINFLIIYFIGRSRPP